MLTISQLLQATWPTPRANSRDVILRSIKSGVTRTGRLPKVIAVAYSPVTPEGKAKRQISMHKCSVTAVDQKKGFKGYVKVLCDCEYQTYYNEVALHKHGASDIVYSNGEPPVDRNPSYKPNLCKHLYALCKRIKGAPKL